MFSSDYLDVVVVRRVAPPVDYCCITVNTDLYCRIDVEDLVRIQSRTTRVNLAISRFFYWKKKWFNTPLYWKTLVLTKVTHFDTSVYWGESRKIQIVLTTAAKRHSG